MRKGIIILSIVFFVLSGYIKFKEYAISASSLQFQNDLKELKSKGVSPEVEKMLEKMAREQAANQAVIKELQATVTTLPSQNDLKAVKSKGVSPEVEKMLEKMAREQAANQAVVKELQAKVTTLPSQNDLKAVKSTGVSPEVEKVLKEIAREQEANQTMVKELQAKVTTLPSQYDLKAVKSKGVSPEVGKMLEKMAREQEANQGMVKELQAMVANLEDRLANEEKAPREYIEPGRVIKGERVLAVLGSGSFTSGQVVISEELMNTIHKIVPDILASPDHNLIVEGHTDNTPIKSNAEQTYKDNMELSFLRAKAVTRILVDNNIPLERISVISYGDTRPIASNETAEGRARNRRVEIMIVPEETEL